MKYRNLDYLRAFAVICVFVCHSALMMRPGPVVAEMLTGMGRFGVILFFFHTSFVLMQSMASMGPGTKGWITRFYVRRIFRIYPLAVFTICLAIALRAPYAPWLSLQHTVFDFCTVFSNLLLAQNLVMAPSILTQLWSLPIEIQMYAVLPFVFLALRRRDWKPWVFSAWLFCGIVALAVYALTQRMNLLAFTGCFLSGCMSYKLSCSVKPKWPSSVWLLSILAVTLGGTAFTRNILAEWFLCLILALVFPRALDMKENWLSKGFHVIAKYSYGIYLMHLFAIWVSFQHLGLLLLTNIIRITAAGLITFVASVICYHLIEDPLIQIGKKVSERLSRRNCLPGKPEEEFPPISGVRLLDRKANSSR